MISTQIGCLNTTGLCAGSGHDLSKEEDKDAPAVTPLLPALQKKSAIQVKSTTSGSSRDHSDDDDELEGETETTRNGDPSDAKRVRRYLVSTFMLPTIVNTIHSIYVMCALCESYVHDIT